MRGKKTVGMCDLQLKEKGHTKDISSTFCHAILREKIIFQISLSPRWKFTAEWTLKEKCLLTKIEHMDICCLLLWPIRYIFSQMINRRQTNVSFFFVIHTIKWNKTYLVRLQVRSLNYGDAALWIEQINFRELRTAIKS